MNKTAVDNNTDESGCGTTDAGDSWKEWGQMQSGTATELSFRRN